MKNIKLKKHQISKSVDVVPSPRPSPRPSPPSIVSMSANWFEGFFWLIEKLEPNEINGMEGYSKQMLFWLLH